MANSLREGRALLLRALAKEAAIEGARLTARYAGEPEAADGDEAGRLEREAQRCEEVLAEVG